ncbi:hypothetical protein PIROE2DRAFT_57484 [Piromyces sp. E2]|nr:hypothetical protein PIROE2DRAFT_57484 [Piromyces sp. E2]|eukprot:OUM69262.1 hypothetical protein PIROE2DRAFT_57484 [Piromyces sp. E2]
MKKKKLTLNSTINKTKITDCNKINSNDTITKVNEININKNIQIKKESSTVLVNKAKLTQNTPTQLNNNTVNNKKKINDYFNTLVKDTITTNTGNNNFDNMKENEKEKLKLKIPDSFKKSNTIFPPVNYNTRKIQQTPLKTKQLHISSNDNGKMILKKKSLSNSQLKNCLLVIYEDIMIDDYENNEDHLDKTDNNVTTIKTNQKLNKDFYNLIINEIKICYNADTGYKTNIDNQISDHKDVEDKCQLKKNNTNSKSYSKILNDIYSLNINDDIGNHISNDNNSTVEKKNKINLQCNNSNLYNERKPTKKVIIQKTLLSTLKSPVIHKSRKRKFSNNTKLNVKQTKLNFLPKKQKTI